MKLKSFIERIISEIGPRPAGSEMEYKAGEIVAEEFRKGGAKVSYHDTRVCPRNIPELINLVAWSYFIGVVLYFIFPIASTIIITVVLGLLFLSRIFGNQVVDWMFKKARTRNIIGVYSPKKKAKEILIFSGHHDSPDNMPLFSQPYKAHLHQIETSAMVGAFLLIPAGILRTIFVGTMPVFPPSLGWYDIIFVLSVIGLLIIFFFRHMMITNERNLGANDNLSAVAVLVGLSDYLKKNPPNETEVWLVSFGSEEPQLYGSIGFAKDYPEVIKKAINVNMETVGSGKLAVINKEKMVYLPYTKEVVEIIQRAGKRAKIDLPAIDIKYGGTDSNSIVRAGGKSACLFGMDETELFSLWHSPLDNPKNIKEDRLQDALKVCIEVLKEFEGEAK
jgi:hypothetical protein